MVLVLDEKQMRLVLNCLEQIGEQQGFHYEEREIAEPLIDRIHQLLDDARTPGWKAVDNPED